MRRERKNICFSRAFVFLALSLSGLCFNLKRASKKKEDLILLNKCSFQHKVAVGNQVYRFYFVICIKAYCLIATLYDSLLCLKLNASLKLNKL